MLKYIRMTVSSNFGNVFSVVIASVFLPFLPMLPLQLLTQNLLYDISQIAIPFDNVDDEMVSQPLPWNAGGIGRFMLFFGPLSSIFDIITFAVMWYVFMANTVENQALFHSGWFVVGLLTQTLIVHIIRTPKMAFIEVTRAPYPTTLVIMVGIFIPMGPLASYFKMQRCRGAILFAVRVVALRCLTSLMSDTTRRLGCITPSLSVTAIY